VKLDDEHFDLNFWTQDGEIIKTVTVKNTDIIYSKKDEAKWNEIGLHDFCLLRDDEMGEFTLRSRIAY
jgi:hypothetical protein